MTAITCEINKIAYSFEVFLSFHKQLDNSSDTVLIIYCT